MADLRAAKAKARKPKGGALSKLKDKKQEAKPKGALGALKARKEDPKPKGALAALKAKKQPKKPALSALREKKGSPRDFTVMGNRRICNARITAHAESGNPIGTVDLVVNGERYTFHNKFGSWFYDVPGKQGYMKEPAPALEMSMAFQKRFDAELKALGIKTAAEKRIEFEKEEKAKRARLQALENAREERKRKKEEKS